MYSTDAYGMKSKDGSFEKISIERNSPGPDDVEFNILYCGICHSDVHFALDYMGTTQYPIVPGHELAGVVTKVGDNVQNYQVGDHVGVGCIVESCMSCTSCSNGLENYCEKGMTMTYAYETKHGLLKTNTGYTFGGYSKKHTVHQRYIIKIPDSYPLECAGPIFCAGITMYSPLKYHGAGNGGIRVGILGIGGLGQMGIQLANALGNEVTAISTNPTKEETCRKLGAKHFVLSSDAEAMTNAGKSLDLILNTIAAPFDCNHYMPLLAVSGTLVLLGINPQPHSINQMSLIFTRQSIGGSVIGGMPETQECIDVCAKHDLKPNIELITNDKLDGVFTALNSKNDSVIRYVLDLAKCT